MASYLEARRTLPHLEAPPIKSRTSEAFASCNAKKYNPLAVIIFLLGLGILAAAMVKSRMTGLAEESFSMAATGIAVVIGAFLLQLIWPLRVYVLVLGTSGGDVDAVVSRNKEFVSNVQKAVEQAFVVRARQARVSDT